MYDKFQSTRCTHEGTCRAVPLRVSSHGCKEFLDRPSPGLQWQRLLSRHGQLPWQHSVKQVWQSVSQIIGVHARKVHLSGVLIEELFPPPEGDYEPPVECVEAEMYPGCSRPVVSASGSELFKAGEVKAPKADGHRLGLVVPIAATLYERAKFARVEVAGEINRDIDTGQMAFYCLHGIVTFRPTLTVAIFMLNSQHHSAAAVLNGTRP